jgi:hypothetical protein
LLLKDGENGTGRIARLELSSERMRQDVVLCAFLVFIQGIIED